MDKRGIKGEKHDRNRADCRQLRSGKHGLTCDELIRAQVIAATLGP